MSATEERHAERRKLRSESLADSLCRGHVWRRAFGIAILDVAHQLLEKGESLALKFLLLTRLLVESAHWTERLRWVCSWLGSVRVCGVHTAEQQFDCLDGGAVVFDSRQVSAASAAPLYTQLQGGKL